MSDTQDQLRAPALRWPHVPTDIQNLAQKAADELDRLQALNSDLLAALKNARTELEEVTVELMGEDYNSPDMNALIAKAEKQSAGEQ